MSFIENRTLKCSWRWVFGWLLVSLALGFGLTSKAQTTVLTLRGAADRPVEDSGSIGTPLGTLAWVQMAKLTGSDEATADAFGHRVVLSRDGDTALVGAPKTEVGGRPEKGTVYIFTRSGPSWILQTELTAGDGAAGDHFGRGLALSGDGNTLAVGAPEMDVEDRSNQGAVYIFMRLGTAWVQQAKIMAEDGAADDSFGAAVALNGDGHTLVAGATGKGNFTQGAAYIFTRLGSTWVQQAQLVGETSCYYCVFGISVALDDAGDTALVGTSTELAAYAFTRSDSTWTQQARFTSSDAAAWDGFGSSVALSGDGNTALMGAPGIDVNGNKDQGAAYVFMRSNSTWTQQARLTADDGAAGDRFGASVALDRNGQRGLVGAYLADVDRRTNLGASYVYSQEGESWTQQAKLVPVPYEHGYFGWSVALNSDGQYALVGGVNYSDGKNGAAYLFHRQEVTSNTLYLPLIVKTELPAPPVCTLYVENKTGSQICFVIHGTGIGWQCYDGGSYLYGAIPEGTYTFQATTVCGDLMETHHFPEGMWTLEIGCAPSTNAN